MTERPVRVFAPASVSNVACGFDVLGFAIDGAGDEVTAALSRTPGVQVGTIEGDGGRLPRDPKANTAAVAAQALLDAFRPETGVRLDICKRMPTSSGLGSSAASAVGAVVAVNELVGARLERPQLMRFALAGEAVASGARHGDNLAPSLYGGLVLVRSLAPEPDVVELSVPEELRCAVLHPFTEIETKASRRLLPDRLHLRDAVTQWGNLAAFVAALYRGDFELMRRSLVDVVAEPARADSVPGFRSVQRVALEAGALGCSLSGSGPAVFALCRGEDAAREIGGAMLTALKRDTGLEARIYLSTLNVPGARRIDG